MDGPPPQQERPWAAQVVLSVTGVPKADRTAIQELVERAGGRYSPNLSRRCTHLAVPRGVSERSEKLHSALRNRHKWGLHIVDLRWVLESVAAGQRLEEGRFKVHPLPQEQATPSVSGRQPADSWAGSGDCISEQAADTYRLPQGGGGQPPATVAAAVARAARPANPLRTSVNSRPLSSFPAGQPAPSLQTQAPSAGRSVRWQISEGSPAQWGAPSGALAAAAAHAAAAAVLPGQVEQQCLVQQEADEEVDFSKLPMTQAGFIPAADLLEQLRASTAGLLPVAPPPPPPAAQLSQPQQQRPSQQHVQQQRPSQQHVQQQQQQPQWQRSSPANDQSQAVQQSPVYRYAWQGSPQQHLPSCMQEDAPQRSPSPHAQPPSMGQPGAAAAISTADLLQQLRLSMAGTQTQPSPQPLQQTAARLPTAELLEQLRQPPAVPLQAAAETLQSSEQRQQQLHAELPAIPTEEFLQQLRSSAVTAPGQQAAQQAQRRADGRLATEDLLAALRAAPAAGPAALPQAAEVHMVQTAASSDLPQLQHLSGSLSSAALHSEHLQQHQRQQPHTASATAELLQQLQAPPLSAAREQQPAKQRAPATADLLQQLQATHVPAAAAGVERSRQQPALSTAELLQQLRASSGMHSMSGRLPAQQAQQTQHDRECGAAGNSGSTAAVATQPGDISGLLQQLQRLPVAAVSVSQHPCLPAAETVPLVQADVAAAAASRLADQLRSLLEDARPAAGLQPAGALAEAADGQPGAGTSSEELLALLRRQQESRLGADMPPAASPAGHGGSDALLAKLRSLAPQAAPSPPCPQDAAAQQLQQPQCAAQWDSNKPASEDQEMPPAKYMRQEEPEGRAPAAFGTLPAAQQAVIAPPATPAADGGVAGDGSSHGGGVSLAPTAPVSGGQPEAAPSPCGSVPASSAGSPPLVRPAAGTPAALSHAVSPAGSGNGKPDAASSQVAESCRVFGGMLAIVDPSLPADEQQWVAAALEQGGGQVAAGGSLARGVTHVVCQPDQALKWLSMGVGIVSPAWVLQSLRTGKQQRCLMVSADASRHLPAASAATGSSSQQPGGSEAGSGGGSKSAHSSQLQLSSDLLASRAARQQALMQLSGQGAAAPACARASTPGAVGPSVLGGHRPAATPAELLPGVLWSVLEPPHAARLEARCQPSVAAEEEEPAVIIPDSEDEEEQAHLCCISASQAAVADVLCEAAGAGQPGGGSRAGADPAAAAAAAAWQQDVVLQGPATITMLLPRDARGELGSDTRSFAVPVGQQAARELTAAQLLAFVHGYYAEELPPAEQLSLLEMHPAAEGAAAVLRPAFLELAVVTRGALLGPRCAFEGLRKATRDPAGAVYEVLLGS